MGFIYSSNLLRLHSSRFSILCSKLYSIISYRLIYNSAFLNYTVIIKFMLHNFCMRISVFSLVLCAFSISFLMYIISVFSRINIYIMTGKYLNDDAIKITNLLDGNQIFIVLFFSVGSYVRNLLHIYVALAFFSLRRRVLYFVFLLFSFVNFC